MIRISTEHYPLVVVELSGEVTMEDVETQRQAYAELHARAQRFALLIEARRVKLPSSPIRRALGELSHEYGEASKRDCIVVSTIIGSKIIAGALQAIRWFVKGDVELVYNASAVEAFEYAHAKAAKEGVTLPGAEVARALDDKHSAQRRGAAAP